MTQQYHLGIISVRGASEEDISTCKAIADKNRDALGFVVRAIFAESIRRSQLLVAEQDGRVVGFVRFNHRVRGSETALYDICIDTPIQRQGVGRLLVQALATSCRERGHTAIKLRCPESLPANNFYAHLGFQQVAVEAGRRRRLVVWWLPLVEA